MAVVTNPNAAVVAGNGVGPTTYGGTIAAVEGTGDGEHVMVQGGPGGAEAVGGISLVATFTQNP